MLAHSRRRSRILTLAASVCAGLYAEPSLQAQCGSGWHPTPGVSGTNATVLATCLWDPDGAGPAPRTLVIAGEFTSAGTTPANNIATWDGTTFAQLGGGIVGTEVSALAVLPDGRLVAAGMFSSAGGTPVNNIAVYDGTQWSPLGSGTDNEVFALAVTPGGDLYAGGLFISAGGQAANRVARWNGAAWSSLGVGTGNGVSGVVYALAVTPSGSLAVGGGFTSAGGVFNRRNVAMWNGSSWTSMGAGMNAAVLSLIALPGDNVVAGGIFTFAGTGPASRVARWSAGAWAPMGAGLNSQPLCFALTEDGMLVAGGHFFSSGGAPVNKIAMWDGALWQPLGSGMDNYVFTQCLMPDGSLYAGGGFTTADGQSSPHLAVWATTGTPTVSQGPSAARACAPGLVTLEIIADGPGTLQYQWQIALPGAPGDWVNLVDGVLVLDGAPMGEVTGALNSAMTLTASHAEALTLRCVVRNECGTATSEAATAEFIQCGCNAADLSAVGGTAESPGDPDGQLTVDDVIVFVNLFGDGTGCPGATPCSRADVCGVGGPPAAPDGELTVDDVIAFFNAFGDGC